MILKNIVNSLPFRNDTFTKTLVITFIYFTYKMYIINNYKQVFSPVKLKYFSFQKCIEEFSGYLKRVFITFG